MTDSWFENISANIVKKLSGEYVVAHSKLKDYPFCCMGEFKKQETRRDKNGNF